MGAARGRRGLAAWSASLILLASCGGSEEEPPPSRSDRVSAAVEAALAADITYAQVRVVTMVADGETLLERYSGSTPGEYHNVASVTKSVLSTLVGIAAEDGLLALDDTLAELLPKYVDQMKPAVASVTLRELITMRGGFISDDAPSSQDFASAPNAVVAALATGTGTSGTFMYSSASAHLVAAALAEATDGSVLSYARKVLFDPLGVDTDPAAEPLLDPANVQRYLAADFAWPVDRQGIHAGWGLLKLRAPDLLALGRLFLDEGEWHGQRLVSQAWVDAATSTQVEVDERESYGYGWWVTELAERDAFAAEGQGGQLVVVVPDLDLVAVTVTGLGEDFSTRISPFHMLTLVEAAIVAGYGRP